MRGLEANASHPHEPCTVRLFQTSEDDLLLRRARGEYREMPGMRLTIDQAARLLNVDRQTCARILDALVASHYLDIDSSGRYRKAHVGQ